MKRFIQIISAVAMIAAIVACQKNPTPDGKCGIDSISLDKASNPTLSQDIKGSIDGENITFIIPTSVTETSFTATFAVSEFDEVKIDGAEATSGEAKIKEGSKIEVADEVSSLEAKYTVKFVANDEVAEILSITFKAADNNLLAEDVAPEAIAPEMVVRVPAAAFRQELKLTVEAGMNDAIKINGEKVESGASIAVDTQFPIDINVTDEISGANQKCVLKVGKILQNFWTTAGTYTNAEVDTYVDLAVDAVADVPYVVTSETTYDPETGKAVTKNMPTVLVCKDGAFAPLGANKFLDCAVTYQNIDVIDGIPYVAFVDAGASTKSRVSCVAYKDGDWSFVGERGCMAKITGLSYYRFDMMLDPVTKYPIVAETTNEAINGLAKRDLCISVFNGSEWDANKPVNGRTQTYCYNEKLARSADALYLLAANQNDKTFSFYQYKDKTWTVLQADLKIEGTTDICTYFADLECDSKGNVYAAIGDNSSGNYLCNIYKYNGTEFVKAFNPIPNATFDNTKDQWSLTFDSNDNPVVAYISDPAEGAPRTVKVVSIDPETKNWADPYDFGEPAETYLSAGRANNGNIYVAYSTTSEDDVNTIVLKKFALEEDILPE